MTTSAYPELSQAEAIFKALIWDNEVKAAEAALFAEVPWLRAWPVGPIVRYVIEHFSDRLYRVGTLYIDTAAIRLVNAEHQCEFDAASTRLMIIAHDKGVDSEDFKKEREDAKAALSRFVRFGG
jgi:hypothetical protein